MKHFIKKITLSTSSPIQIVDISDQVRAILDESGVREGMVNILTPHTTAAININEKEEGLQQDMVNFLSQVVSPEADYIHNRNAADGRANAHSHLMSIFTNSSETVPVFGRELVLGEWQSIFFIELDGPRDERGVVVQVSGD